MSVKDFPIDQRKHHPHGPSRWPALMQCSLYEAGETGDGAKRGTIMHEYLSALIEDDLEKIAILSDLIPLNDLELVRGVYDGIKNEWMEKGTGDIISSELRVSYYGENIDDDPLYFGTIDAMFENAKGPTTLHIYDMKTGFHTMDATYQMAGYAAAAMDSFSLIENVVATIIEADTGKVTSLDFDRKKCKEIVDSVFKKINQHLKTPTPCDYCKWCRHATQCPALSEKARSLKLPNTDDPLAISQALRDAKIVKCWVDAIEERAKKIAIENGGKIPGFKIQKQSGRREVTDARLAAHASGLDMDEFLTLCSVRIGELEKKLGKEIKRVEPYIKRRADSVLIVEEKEI